MRRISVTGWVPEDETEGTILYHACLDPYDLRKNMEGAVYLTKKGYESILENVPGKRVRITVEIDVEVLTPARKGKKK